MDIGIILLAVFLPQCVVLTFVIIQKFRDKASNTMTGDDFTIMLPSMVAGIGIVEVLTFLILLLGFTFLSDERPHFSFYFILGLFIWLGIYLIVKTITFKVIVKGEEIIVFSAFRKPYSFTVSEITSVVRQVKKNQLKSERMIIKTEAGKKIIVESSEISYKKFMKKIESEVRKEYLVGFE